MRIALVDSGFGLLATAAALRRARPDADLVLSMDPDHMPWGPRPVAEITRLAHAGAEAAVRAGDTPPDALVVACNTASVHALPALRAAYEPAVPVVGTVPAVKRAADLGAPVAIWATPATTGSRYQHDLIDRFARGTPVTPVACPGLAEAVESGSPTELAAAVATAAVRTPADARAVVLGCTHYELVRAQIQEALPSGAVLYGAADAVAAQTLRRVAATARPDAAPTGAVTVLRSGRAGELPPAALAFPDGALLAGSAAGAHQPLS